MDDKKIINYIKTCPDPSLLKFISDKLFQYYEEIEEQKKDISWHYQIIEDKIPHGSSVLDLGCGRGELLERLVKNKAVRPQGVELDHRCVVECVRRNVPVFHTNLDEGLKGFSDKSFDYVVLEETLQTLHKPLDVLSEMLRVGRHSIVSFPNFGYWRVRFDLFIRGSMPVTGHLPYEWYNTPNIHLFTLQDFLDWTVSEGIYITDSYVMSEGKTRSMERYDNIYAEEVLLFMEKS